MNPDAQFLTGTIELLDRFGPPDASVRRHDGFGAAFRVERDVPWMDSDAGRRNDSDALLFTRDVQTVSDGTFRMIVCGANPGGAKRVEGELLELVMEDVKWT